MRDLALGASVAAIFAFGWYLMRKIDVFLASNRQDQAASLPTGEKILRIGFFDPLVADSLADVLERCSKEYPDISLSLVSGTETQLMREFVSHQLDMIFLPENAAVSEKIRGRVGEISLQHMPVMMQYGGLQIGPITKGYSHQKIVWAESGITPETGRFIKLLRSELVAAGSSK